MSFRLKFISPCGYGTWKNGNVMGRYSPELQSMRAAVVAKFWMKSQTLLYSLEGSQSLAPT